MHEVIKNAVLGWMNVKVVGRMEGDDCKTCGKQTDKDVIEYLRSIGNNLKS